MSRPNDPPADVSVRCVPDADLTAYAHGELPDVRRAEVSRHLLRCARCRGEADASRALFGRLRSFGAEGEDWRAEIAAARAPLAAGRRARVRAATAGLLAASALLAVTWVLSSSPSAAGRRDGGAAQVADALPDGFFPQVGATLLPEDESALLQAQQMDGRWSAGGGHRDEAATSLAVAALARRYGRLADDTVGQAARYGLAWLLARPGLGLGVAAPDDAPRAEVGDAHIAQDGADAGAAHALATTALLEVYAATGDRTLRTPIDRALRALQNAGRADLSGDPTLRWVHRALTRARELGWEGLDPSLRRVGEWMGGETRVASGAPEENASAMMALAMRMVETSRG